MAPKKKVGAVGAAAPAAPELNDEDVDASDDELVYASDDALGFENELPGGEVDGDDEGGEGEMEEGDDEDNVLPNSTRLKEAARRQQPAGPGPLSTAAGGAKLGGLVADTALMMQTETSDATLLQIEADELLSETRAKYSKGSGVEAVLGRLKDALLSMPEHQVSMGIAKGFVETLGVPFEDSLTIKPPAAVTIVGSYAAHAIARPESTVDVAIQLPTDFLPPKAHLNYRYHARRAVYLVAIARHLANVSYSLFGEQHLEALHGDPCRPALLLQPPKAEGFALRLLPCIAPTTFALPRLAPDRNGVRAHCKRPTTAPTGAAAVAAEQQQHHSQPGRSQEDGQRQEHVLPTSHYNAGILEDMLLPVHAARLKTLLSSSPRLLDGLLLLKVWARQHGLVATTSQHGPSSAGPAAFSSAPSTFGAFGGGCLDGCVLAMLVLLLSERNKMASAAMTALQVFRAALQLLADSAAWSKGLVLGRQDLQGLPASAQAPPPVATFKSHFQVVFLDPTGWLNLAAHMTRGSLAHAQLIARRTLEVLNAPADPDEAFAAALLTPAGPAAAFDYHWRISLPSGSTWHAHAGQGAETEKSGGALCRDRVLWRDQEVQIEQLVRQALSDRAKCVRVLRHPCSRSAVPDDLERGLIPPATFTPSTTTTTTTTTSSLPPTSVWVGAVLDPLAACRLVDVGPSADDGPAAARFRRFWGDKAELRRWQDGKITETAVWEVAPHQRHTIPDLILAHTAARHLPAGSTACGAAGCLDWALGCRACPAGADLAAARAAEAAVEKLGKQLRGLDGLALKVVSVQPLSSVARGTAPLPPQPHPLAGGSAAAAGTGSEGGGGTGQLPRCLDPLDVLVTLENSGRWPDDPTAFRKMKAALGLQLASSLAASYGLHVSASEDAVDVLADGFAFRLVLYSGRDEAMLTKAAATSAAGGIPAAAAGSTPGVSVGAGLLSPEESPLLLSWHHGLVTLVGGANSAFAPAARLAGRWVAAHMMSNHVAPQVVELLVAAAFGGAGAPAGPQPGSRLTGFLRFLQLLARWPWSLLPLVVDPAAELREADRRALRKRFEARKAAGEAPAMYICTPRDRESRHWTHKGPSTAALQRLTVLAARSAAILQLLLQPQANTSPPMPTPSTTASPSGLQAAWAAVFATPATDFDAFIVLRKEALPHADLALAPPTAAAVKPPTPCSGSAATALAALLLPPGGAVRDVVVGLATRHGGDGVDTPASGPDALSDALEDAPPLEPPPKRARAFLRAFPDKVVAARGAARLQSELLVGFDPVHRLLAELAAIYGHLATFCVDGLGGRLVGVRWAPEAFMPQPLRLNTAHTALPLVLTTPMASAEAEEEAARNNSKAGRAGSAVGLCVPNVFVVMHEVKELGLGLVEDWVMPTSSAKARAAW